ncbi:MAG: zinc/manganese transport system substrate-binding protein [Archaeoglobi archaeon]|nr:zinc/manganese transport system substrate-binding protein [Archaeoglobi archaeon]MDK2781179.1 zinc/manganese transport system substrate-binding protein [Archaeoglobi archaeon]
MNTRIGIALVLAVLLSLISPAAASEGTSEIVCTTTVLGSIVEDLTGERCEVIASASVCPAHYDIKPSDVEKVKEADVILCHGIEPWVDELVKSSGREIKVVKISGAWNTPEALREMYIKVAEALEEAGYEVNLEKCLESVNQTESYLKEFAEENGFVGTPVVCMQWQASFLRFLGFEVVATYPPPEMISAKKYEEILNNATGAKLVVDNLQSGTDFGRELAEKLGAKHAAISNFPLEGNVTEMMIENARTLADALKDESTAEESPGFEIFCAAAALISSMLLLRRS